MKTKILALMLSFALLTPITFAAGPTAICKDGTYSYSKRRSGTCSHHKGVSKWY